MDKELRVIYGTINWKLFELADQLIIEYRAKHGNTMHIEEAAGYLKEVKQLDYNKIVA